MKLAFAMNKTQGSYNWFNSIDDLLLLEIRISLRPEQTLDLAGKSHEPSLKEKASVELEGVNKIWAWLRQANVC